MNNQQAEIPVYQGKPLSEENKQLNALFVDMRGKQLDFLDESGKSLIERIATFLAVLFGVTVLSSTFPPPYLKGNVPAKVVVVLTLIFYIMALLCAIRAVRPFPYIYGESSLTSKREALQEMTARKTYWLKYANTLFVGGCVALSLLIILVIWNL